MFNLFRKKSSPDTTTSPDTAWIPVEGHEDVQVRMEHIRVIKVRSGPEGSRLYGRYELTDADSNDGRVLGPAIQARVEQFLDRKSNNRG